MPEPAATADAPLPPALALYVNGVCDRFEAAWKAVTHGGPKPRIEDYLAGTPGAGLATLVRHLVLLEIDYRLLRGEQPGAAEYRARFPGLSDRFLDEALAPPTRPGPTTVPASLPIPPPSPPGPAAPRFGKYALLEKIDQGGMGVVYKVWDTGLGRVVALKVIRSGALAQPEEVARFHQEAKAVARLNHPHIVPIYEIDEYEGEHYFTMKFAEGGSLARSRRDWPMDPRGAAALLEKIARAVHHAHTRDIVHRDLKPANVLLDENGEPLVSDFGLAKLLDASVALTPGQAQLGTPPYMAPEQLAGGSSPIDARTDVWSLGVIAYELLTGRRPFLAKEPEVLYREIREDEPPGPRALRPAVPRDLETICLMCLHKEPRARYQSAEALAADLRNFLDGQPILGRRASVVARLRRVVRRHPALATAGGFLALLAALALLPFLTPRPPDPYEEHCRSAAAELSADRPAPLIPAAGRGTRFRWVAGQPYSKTEEGEGQPFRIHTTGSAVVELLADPARDRYRFRAEVRHTQSLEGGEVGIYVLSRRHATAGGEVLSWCQLTFNDIRDVLEAWRQLPEGGRPPRPEGNPVQLTPRLFAEGPREDADWTHELPGVAKPWLNAAGFAAPAPWHTLALEVTPQAVRGYWDGRYLGGLTAAEWDQGVRQFATLRKMIAPDDAHLDGLDLTFTPRGGLGLCLRNGSAAFRNATVEPLNED